MSDLPPPPPYTPRDPNSPTLTPPSSAEQSPPEQTVILTPPDSPASIQQHHDVESPPHNPCLSSSLAYFESRPSLIRRPNHILTNHIIIPPDATPSDIPFPPSATWRARDVDDRDWATFLNHLFPQHHRNTNAQIADKKIRAEISYNLSTGSSSVEKLRSAQLDGLLRSDDNDENQVESETERSKRIKAVVREWNEGFFLPRGLKVVGIVQPPSGSSREEAPSSGDNTGYSYDRWGDQTEHHGGFPHHGRHSRWNIDPNGSHGCGHRGRGRRRGHEAPSTPDAPNLVIPHSASYSYPPYAPGATGVPPYVGLGEAVRHTAAQIGDAARYTAMQLGEAARLTGQQVEEAARSTASQVSDAARYSGVQLNEASRLAGQQVEEAARQSAAQLGHLSRAQNRGTTAWNRNNTSGPPSPCSFSHHRQSTSSSSRSFPSSLPSNSSSLHPHHDSKADVTELTNAMEAIVTSFASERPDAMRTWNRDAKRQYKERDRERKVEIQEMKQELRRKMLEAKEERKRVKEVKKALKDAKKSEKKSRKAEIRKIKLREKMEKAEIKLVGKGAIDVLAKGDNSLTADEKEYWMTNRFEGQEVGVLEKDG
ncbi:hypothetical protein FGG08_001206 [Glutinoglossum americanum]|uniref:Uncharacterized protein n=1 Tax=Glutinoglossum americanum TaxID=1670608 RepID=A0A9P8IE01_9PEZI|nr:hypothetical protein FGG08_001206 [Glutinoglossum americanum]